MLLSLMGVCSQFTWDIRDLRLWSSLERPQITQGQNHGVQTLFQISHALLHANLGEQTHTHTHHDSR